MRILGIDAKDFCSFPGLVLDLHEQGLVWIGGENKDSDAADSNGSGKSNIFKAIGWGLFGEAIDGHDGDEVIRDGCKMSKVCLHMEDHSGTWTVKRERRKAQPRLVLVKPDGEDWQGSRKETQAKINEMIGMDFHAFRNTVLYGQGERKRFTDPAVKDSERKVMLHNILRTSILKACHKLASDKNLKVKKQQAELESEIGTLKARVGEHDLEGLKRKRDDFNDRKRSQALRLAGEARDYVSKAKACQGQASEAEQLRQQADQRAAAVDIPLLQAELKALESDSEAAFDAGVEAQRCIDKFQSLLIHIEERLALLEGDKCSQCSAPLSKGAPAKLIKDLAQEAAQHRAYIESKRHELKRITRVSATARTAVLDKRREITEASDEMDETRDLRHRADKLMAESNRAREYAELARSKASEAAEARDAENPHTAAYDAAKAKVDKYRKAIAEKQSELKTLAEKRSLLEFWVRGFSDHGLPSFILDSVMPYITERSNHYLEILSDGDISMEFSTQRELKSSKGEMRDEIDISWFIEGKQGYPPSGGQLKKMEIATDLALMDLVATREGAHINMLMLDEVLDGLDKEGRTRVVRLLHELRKARGTILVVSHDSDVADAFEKAIMVVMEGGESVLKDAA